MAEKLEKYYAKRDFSLTPEPRGTVHARQDTGLSFVIQKHAASQLHYDFRLELDGVLLSWAVPKGPSLDPRDKRLAMQTEDHPIEYGDFEGIIPRGQYGGGTVLLWDRGTWEPVGDPQAGYEKGHLRFRLDGEKLQGEWNLVRLKGGNKYDKGGDNGGKAWLLMKVDDGYATHDGRDTIVDAEPASVKTARTIEQIAAEKDRVWESNRSVAENVAAGAVDAKPAARRKAARSAATAESAAKPAKGRSSAAKASAKPARSAEPAEVPRAELLDELPGVRKARLPREMSPMLATLVTQAPTGDDWLHEVKYDGYRMLARIDDGDVEIVSRNGKVWTPVLGGLPKALEKLRLKSAWLDGEVVVIDAKGNTSFNALQNALGGSGAPLTYILFDVMHLDGYDLTGVPLVERKRVLGRLLAGVDPDGPLRFSPDVQGNGPEFFEQACALGLEGAICKRANSPYRTAARSREWIKVKCAQRQEMVIGGYTDPQGSRTGFGALLLGVYDDGTLRYAGKVGTGFDSKTLQSVYKLLKTRELNRPAFVNPPRGYDAKGAHWVKPDLVAEVSFTEWSPDGALRHPSFQGLREDKVATDVKRERPAAPAASDAGDDAATLNRADAKTARGTGEMAKTAKGNGSDLPIPAAKSRSTGGKAPTIVAGITMSNPDKPYFPELPFSKVDLARYYEAVAPWILPHLKNRPLSLVRCPEGWNAQCFYQKNADRAVNAAVSRVEVPESKGTATYMAANSAAALVGLVQWGVIELHPWGSRTPRLDKPDQLIIDFDPDEGLKWEPLVEAVQLLRTMLEDLGLVGFLKTTGGKGLHVVLPIRPTLTWDDAKGFTGAIAELLAGTLPDRFTAVMSKERRKGRIFIDYLRNAQGATAIAPYAVRARAGAPVSMPIAWDELKRDVRADFFNVTNALQRLDRMKSDPWADFLTTKQTVTRDMLKRVHYKPR